MFNTLSEGFRKASSRFRGKARLTDENISQAIEDIQESLLEADVEYGVARDFLDRVRENSLGEDIKLRAGRGSEKLRVTPGDHFVKICKEELEKLMGPVNTDLNWVTKRPSSIMMIGLQGTGKTLSLIHI